MSVIRPPASTWFPMLGFFLGLRPRAARATPQKPMAAKPAAAKPRAAKAAAPKVDFDRIMAGFNAPRAEAIEWKGGSLEAAAPVPQCAVNDECFSATSLDGRRRKIRDRYIAARFPGIAKCGADLGDEEKVIRIARLMFEDERADDAVELLQLAIEEFPRRPAAWLARLEILYLVRDAGEFTRMARAFSQGHGKDGETWTEVCRLGRALAPDEALFAGDSITRDHEHYGPWPHTPNWIRSSWDLTSEVAAAEFHGCLRRARENAAKEAA